MQSMLDCLNNQIPFLWTLRPWPCASWLTFSRATSGFWHYRAMLRESDTLLEQTCMPSNTNFSAGCTQKTRSRTQYINAVLQTGCFLTKRCLEGASEGWRMCMCLLTENFQLVLPEQPAAASALQDMNRPHSGTACLVLCICPSLTSSHLLY